MSSIIDIPSRVVFVSTNQQQLSGYANYNQNMDWNGYYHEDQSNRFGDSVTIEVDIPIPTATVTSTWTEVGSSTNTIPATPGQTGTVEVDLPVPTSTITQTHTGL